MYSPADNTQQQYLDAELSCLNKDEINAKSSRQITDEIGAKTSRRITDEIGARTSLPNTDEIGDRIGNEEQLLYCWRCPKSYTCKDSLVRHFKKKHFTKEEFQGKFSLNRFWFNSCLTEHMVKSHGRNLDENKSEDISGVRV